MTVPNIDPGAMKQDELLPIGRGWVTFRSLAPVVIQGRQSCAASVLPLILLIDSIQCLSGAKQQRTSTADRVQTLVQSNLRSKSYWIYPGRPRTLKVEIWSARRPSAFKRFYASPACFNISNNRDATLQVWTLGVEPRKWVRTMTIKRFSLLNSQ